MQYFILFFLAISSFFSTPSFAEPTAQLITSSEINEISVGHPVKDSRDAAVKILSPTGGHGSGLYVTHGKYLGVLTAAHVVDDGSIYKIVVNDAVVFGAVIWRSADEDIAFLIVEPGLDRKPLKLIPAKKPEAGNAISYSGYPSSYDLLSVNGFIAGFDDRGYILMQGFGWFGSSGSGVINGSNKIVGVVTALPVEEFYGYPQVLETIILLTPLREKHVQQINTVLELLD